jgi:hypothetical protein
VNDGLLIVPIIETNQSLENLDAIASVPGVERSEGPISRTSIELGVPLDYSCDTYQRVLDKIASAAAKHGIAAGMYFIPPEIVRLGGQAQEGQLLLRPVPSPQRPARAAESDLRRCRRAPDGDLSYAQGRHRAP